MKRESELTVMQRVINLSPRVRRMVWRQVYQFLASRYPTTEWTFMNYGYEALDGRGPTPLQAADEVNRYFIQLYHYVATAVSLADLDVLEVGSGRGGGAAYMMRYLGPKTMTGVDFSQNAVDFCRQTHQIEGLTFEKGDAEALPFADASFDAVVNVESSHCYGSMTRFLDQVRRVLRPDGHFLFADLRNEAESALLQSQMEASGMILLRKVDITKNVVQALDAYNVAKLALINRILHRALMRPFLEFAGVKGSRVYEEFRNGRKIYHHYLLKK